jgi:hypothetical protein
MTANQGGVSEDIHVGIGSALEMLSASKIAAKPMKNAALKRLFYGR